MSAGYKISILAALIAGLAFRLIAINGPVADWHSHRQADTASVTRIFLAEKPDLIRPRYHDLSNVQSGLENPAGYRMVEFPIYNFLSFLTAKVSGRSVEISSRYTSILLSLGSALLIYFISFRFTRNFYPAFAAMLVFLFLPFNIYYSRAILPEPAAVFFMLAALLAFPDRIVISAVLLALSILIKPYTAIILFPVFLYLGYLSFATSDIKLKKIIYFTVFSVITFTPFIAWRFWIGRFPEGIPKSDWLLNNGTTTTFPNWFHGYDLTFLNKLVAFRPHWFKWLFFERTANLILGSFGLIPLFLGLVYRKNHTPTLAFGLLSGIILYFSIVARGNIQHDYYQVLIVPAISLLAGFGSYYLYRFTFKSRWLSLFSLTVIWGLSLYFSFDQVKNYYRINRPEIVLAGTKAREFLPHNSLVIAPYLGDTAFLYQTGFSGWPTEIYDFANIIKLHPGRPLYLVSVNFDDYTNSLISKNEIVLRTDEFIILRINEKNIF